MDRPPISEADFRRETNDRLRRMETRLTKFMEWSGFDTEVRRPRFADGRLTIPTDATSLRDCLATIPDHWTAPVILVHKGQVVAVLTRQ